MTPKDLERLFPLVSDDHHCVVVQRASDWAAFAKLVREALQVTPMPSDTQLHYLLRRIDACRALADALEAAAKVTYGQG